MERRGHATINMKGDRTFAVTRRVLMRRFAGGLAVAGVASGGPGASLWAEQAGDAGNTGDERSRRREIARLQAYLDRITSLHSRFLQINPDGSYADGTVRILRPGRMRIDYAPPIPITIIADGTWFIFIDAELQEATYLPLDRTPANILLQKTPLLGGNIQVREIIRDFGLLRATLIQADAPDAGALTLTFDDDPLKLRKWTVADAQGQTTQVTLIRPRFDSPQPEALFRFVNPWRQRENSDR